MMSRAEVAKNHTIKSLIQEKKRENQTVNQLA